MFLNRRRMGIFFPRRQVENPKLGSIFPSHSPHDDTEIMLVSTDLWPILQCPWRGTPTWHRPVSLGGPLHWCLQIQRCAWGSQNFPASFRKLPTVSCHAHQTDLHANRKSVSIYEQSVVTWSKMSAFLCAMAICSLFFTHSWMESRGLLYGGSYIAMLIRSIAWAF